MNDHEGKIGRLPRRRRRRRRMIPSRTTATTMTLIHQDYPVKLLRIKPSRRKRTTMTVSYVLALLLLSVERIQSLTTTTSLMRRYPTKPTTGWHHNNLDPHRLSPLLGEVSGDEGGGGGESSSSDASCDVGVESVKDGDMVGDATTPSATLLIDKELSDTTDAGHPVSSIDHQHQQDLQQSTSANTPTKSSASANLSRRDWFQQQAAVLLGGTAVAAGAAAWQSQQQPSTNTHGGLTRAGPLSSNAKGSSVITNPLSSSSSSSSTVQKKLAPVNITKVVQQTSINITMECTSATLFASCVSLDSTTFTKKRQIQLPSWFPLLHDLPVMSPQEIKVIPNEQVILAGILAGSVVEMTRTSLLYPLLTLKTRIQNDVHNTTQVQDVNMNDDESVNTDLSSSIAMLQRRWQTMRSTAKEHFAQGNLYAGLLPSLLISVPTTGVYYAIRDVVKRSLVASNPMSLFWSHNPIVTSIVAALIADVCAVAIRTPADTLSMRLQVASGNAASQLQQEQQEEQERLEQERDKIFMTDPLPPVMIEIPSESFYFANEAIDPSMLEHEATDEERMEEIVEETVGNWFYESLERLPASVLTDLPYLLSRIALNQLLFRLESAQASEEGAAPGAVDFGHYEVTAIATALLCGFLTTPFDVARTRILVDSDANPTNGIDGGSGEGLLRTFRTIIKEGGKGNGYANLFAGWLERTLYLGIGRAWLEPFQLVGYTAIRDAILLEWFD